MTVIFALIFLLPLWGIYMTCLVFKQSKELRDWAKRIEDKDAMITKLRLQIEQIANGKKTKKG